MTDKQQPENSEESLNEEIEHVEEELEQEAGEELDELAQAEAKAAEHWDRLLRLQADMDNIKRRSERDVANAHKFAVEKFVKDLLPVMDSLEMAMKAETTEDSKALVEGIELTHKMFLDNLAKHKVKQLDPEGEPFDPDLHEAISMQDNKEVDSNTVLVVMQKGYTLNDRLVRPALVVVSQ
tara:strand:- start:89835 stop:90377 length:543 start_codon:yes stop_codon:yes gene_type:complete